MTLPYFMIGSATALLVNIVIVLIAPQPSETPSWAGPCSTRTISVRLGLLAAAPISVPVRLLSQSRRVVRAACRELYPTAVTIDSPTESVAALPVGAGE